MTPEASKEQKEEQGRSRFRKPEMFHEEGQGQHNKMLPRSQGRTEVSLDLVIMKRLTNVLRAVSVL